MIEPEHCAKWGQNGVHRQGGHSPGRIWLMKNLIRLFFVLTVATITASILWQFVG
jgi:hypothetical protein